jgi:hypothetical protein
MEVNVSFLFGIIMRLFSESECIYSSPMLYNYTKTSHLRFVNNFLPMSNLNAYIRPMQHISIPPWWVIGIVGLYRHSSPLTIHSIILQLHAKYLLPDMLHRLRVNYSIRNRVSIFCQVLLSIFHCVLCIFHALSFFLCFLNRHEIHCTLICKLMGCNAI